MVQGRPDRASPGRTREGESHGGCTSCESHGMYRDTAQDRNIWFSCWWAHRRLQAGPGPPKTVVVSASETGELG